MSGALDQLRDEHQVILQVVQRMEDVIGDRTVRPSRDMFLRAAVEFVRVYADANHHGKEEQALFDMMRRSPRLAGMASLLAEEHVDGRAQIGALEQALDAHQDGAVQRAVLGYVSYIRAHIAKEDGMIFEAAEDELTPEDEAELERAFAYVEASALGAGGLKSALAPLNAARPAGTVAIDANQRPQRISKSSLRR